MRENVASLPSPALFVDDVVVLSERREIATAALKQLVRAFMELEQKDPRSGTFYHHLLALVHEMCASILVCEEAGLNREEIVAVLEPVRRVHARSPFVARLQQWPRGYPGDFETVEHLVAGAGGTHVDQVDDVARSCETYALSRAIAQQHRNKVQHQSQRILRTLLSNPGQTRIASIACGSCPDLRSIQPLLPLLVGELWLNDIDPDALDVSRKAMNPIAGRCQFREGDAISATRRFPRGAFDLVLAGGLYDYLEERPATLLIQLVYRLLAPGGTFFFTNIARGNPYRPLIEYFGDWVLIERTEEDIYRYCENAGIGRANVNIRRDETGLALLIEVTRLE